MDAAAWADRLGDHARSAIVNHGDRGLRVVAVLAVLLVAAAVWAWLTFVVDDRLETYGPSMRPTMAGHGKVSVDEDAYASGTLPQPGEIVALQGPAGVDTGTCAEPTDGRSPCGAALGEYSSLRLLKRVVAEPGDSVAFAPDGTLIRNGTRVPEPYIRPCPGTCALPRPVRVPPGHYFVAGDNRPASSDSRIWGPVPLEAIDGRVVAPMEVE